MKSVQVKFLPGDTAYLLSEALKGHMTKCEIDSVLLTTGEVKYFNLFNGYYCEGELLSEAEARKIVLDFHEAEIIKLLNQA